MQARCPHCQSVFSTDRSGIQFCPHCGQQLDVPGAAASAPLPVPSAGPGPGEPAPPGGGSAGTPWERRRELGFVPAVLETIKQVLVDPVGFFTALRAEGSWTDALLYAWLLFGVSTLLSLPLRFIGMGAGMSQLQQVLRQANLPPEQMAQIEKLVGAAGGSGLFSAVAYPLFLIIAAAIIHVCCMITGAARNGYYATFRVVAYAATPLVFSFVPCVGPLASIYYLVLTVIGVWKVQSTTPMRAAFGVLLPILAFCCCCGGIFGTVMMAAVSKLGHS